MKDSQEKKGMCTQDYIPSLFINWNFVKNIYV